MKKKKIVSVMLILCMLLAHISITYADKDEDDILSTISDMYLDSCSDWAIMDMASYGMLENVKDEDKTNYYNSAIDTIKTSSKITDLAKAAIILSSMGYDATCVDGGLNILEKIENSESIGGINGVIFSLIAYDCCKYNISRDELIDYITDNQHTDGGWSLSNEKSEASDPDMTAMALSALAPYCDDKKEIIDDGVLCLSNMQCESGGFSSWGTENSSSVATVITALSALGIDADTDERFIKNNVSALDALLSYKTDDNKFGYTDNTFNAFSTEQGFRALVSYKGFKKSGEAYNVYSFSPIVTKSINLRIEGISENKAYLKNYEVGYRGDNLSVTNAVMHILSTEDYVYENGYFSTFFDEKASTFNNDYDGWMYMVNGETPMVGMDSYYLNDGDSVLIYYGGMSIAYPNKPTYKFSGNTCTVNFTYEKTTYDTSFNATVTTEPIQDAKIMWNSSEYTTDENGDIKIENATSGDYSVQINKVGTVCVLGKYQPLVVRFEPDYMFNIYKKPSSSGGGGGSSVAKATAKPTAAPTAIPTAEPTTTPNCTFTDIDEHWAKEYITELYFKGLINGKSDTEFAPNDFITRAEFVSMIYRFCKGKSQVNKNIFSDVPSGVWYEDAVNYAYEEGLVKGGGDNEFSPNYNITREETAVIISRLLSKPAKTDKIFKDDNLISDWAKEDVYSAVANGIFSGDENNRFNPKNYLTRAEAAKIFCKIS